MSSTINIKSLMFGAYFMLFMGDGLYSQLSPEEKRRRDKRTPRIALRHFVESPFLFMYHSGNDQALINCCGVDHRTFSNLLAFFSHAFNAYTFDEQTGLIRKRKKTKGGAYKGRRRELDATGCLGLVLYWYRTRGSVARALALAFGLTSTPMYKWLKFGRRILLSVLQHVPEAKVKQPTQQEFLEYSNAIEEKYPLLQQVWGAADGLKLHIQQSGNYLIQNRYYNGWKSCHYINSVFVFGPDGKIKMCTINCPGTWHDSTMADYGIYSKLESIYNDFGGKIVVDSAFNLGNKPYLIKSAQTDPITAVSTELSLNRQATSLRQLSEHGMRMIGAQFPRLKDNMPYEEFGERKVILALMLVLYNYQASQVGINEILNSFMHKTDGSFYYNQNISTDANDQLLN